MRIIIDDYVQSPGKRTFFKGALYTATTVGMVMGTAVIVMFDPRVGG